MATILFVFVLALCAAIVSKLFVSGVKETAENLTTAQLRLEFYSEMKSVRSAKVADKEKYRPLFFNGMSELTHAALFNKVIPPFVEKNSCMEELFDMSNRRFNRITDTISRFVWRETKVKDVAFKEYRDFSFYCIYIKAASVGARNGNLYVFDREGAIIYSAPNTRSERIKFLKAFGVLPRRM